MAVRHNVAVPDRIRVAVDATPLLGTRTGVGVFCLEALRALSDRPTLDVEAFAVSWRRRHGIEEHLPAGVRAEQRAVPARPMHALWDTFSFPPFEWFVGRADVVHGTNFRVPPTRRAARVCSVHDLTPVHHPEMCQADTLKYPAAIRRAVRQGAWVHTDSAFVRDEVIEAFSADPSRVRVVAPGVPSLPAVGAAAVAAVDAHWPELSGRRLVLAVGTAEPRKDLPGLVDAFGDVARSVDDVMLVLAGPAGWGERELEAALARSKVASRIVRPGWVDDATLAALFARSSVLAFPSRYEGFGFPPLQAMAAGLPVVATNAGSLPEVLGDAAVMVEAGSVEALAGALLRVVSDDGLVQQLRDAGRRQAATFSWKACGDGLEALYQDAVRANG